MRCARYIKLIAVSCLCMLMPAVQALARAQELLYFDRKSGKERARASYRINHDKQKKEVALLILGKGAIGPFKDVRFQQRARLQENGFLKPIESERIIYDKKDKVIGGVRFLYDYDKKTVTYIELKEEKQTAFEKVFPLQGPTCDPINFPVFIEKFLSHPERRREEIVYLIDGPEVIKFHITQKKPEYLYFPTGTVAARKIQFVEDRGPLTPLSARFASKKFVWFSPELPHRWLKYEDQQAEEFVVIKGQQ